MPDFFIFLLVCLAGCKGAFGSSTLVIGRPACTYDPPVALTKTTLQEGLEDFSFSCEKHKDWILENDNTCNSTVHYVMLFNQEGKVLEHIHNTNYIQALTTEVKNPRERKDEDLFYWSFLFRIVISGEFVRVQTSADRFLAKLGDGELALVRESECAVHENSIQSQTLELACKTRGDCSSTSCDWTLNKKGIYLEIENKNGLKLKFEDGTLTLKNKGELFTGMNTNFRIGHSLHSDPDISPPTTKAKAYGDIVVHYKDREGGCHEGYLCDYMWDRDDANVFCKERNFESGIPTYDGEYSHSSDKDEFALSGQECDSNLDSQFTSCPFLQKHRTDQMFQQFNMRAFDGNGYACSMKVNRDISGVICGDENEIRKLQEATFKCDREMKSKNTVGQMLGLQEQIRKVKTKKGLKDIHWSDFLLPIPMSVTLLSSVLLTSSETRPIILKEPDTGFVYLKWKTLDGNLVFLAHSIEDSFFVSHKEMTQVKSEAETIHRSLFKVQEYAFQKKKSKSQEALLKYFIKQVGDSATSQIEHVDKIIFQFNMSDCIIKELIQSMSETDAFNEQDKIELQNIIAIKRKQNEERQKILDEKMKLYEEYEANTKVAKDRFFAKANKLLTSRCIDEGASVCNSCHYQGNLIQKGDDNKPLCNVPRRKVCTKYRSEKEGKCLVWEKKCNQWIGCCICHRGQYDDVCVKWQEEKVCDEWDDNFCSEYKYLPAGSYCFDSRTNNTIGTDMCGACNHHDEIRKDMGKMTTLVTNLLENKKHDQSTTEELVEFMLNIAGKFKDLQDALQNIIQSTLESDQEEENNQEQEIQDDVEDDSKIGENEQKQKKKNDLEQNNEKAQENMEEKKAHDRAQRDKVKNNLVLLQNTLQQAQYLFPSKDQIETNERQNFIEDSNTLIDMIKMANGPLEEQDWTEKLPLVEQMSVSMQSRIKKLRQSDMTGDKVKVAQNDIGQLAEEAITFQEMLKKRNRLENEVISLSSRMAESLETILTSEIKSDDLETIILYLRETSKQLTHISSLWQQIRLFFDQVANLVRIRKDGMWKMLEDVSIDENLLEELKESTLTAMATNSYTYSISKFYTSLTGGVENNLLKKISLVTNDRHRFRSDKTGLERFKKSLLNEALVTQQRIKEEVQKEEVKINNRLLKNLKLVENEFACALENATSEEDKERILNYNYENKRMENERENEKRSPPETENATSIKTQVPYFSLDD